MFIEVDGESLAGGRGRALQATAPHRAEGDPYQDEAERPRISVSRAGAATTGEENGELTNP